MHEISPGTLAMKESLREKFKQKVNFVRPLYRKVKLGNRVKPMRKLLVTVNVKQNDKPCGNGIYVKRKIFNDNNVDYCVDIASENGVYDSNLPGVCDRVYQQTYSRFKTVRNVNDRDGKYVKNVECKSYNISGVNGKMKSRKDIINDQDKSVPTVTNISLVQVQQVPVYWLRVYPAPQSHDESILTLIFRCLVCQLGLAAFLVLWTILWVFVVQYFEGPFEIAVSLEYEKEQNQLVIDLATELRQITPLSLKWRNAIERRIEDERKITIEALGDGAKVHGGYFWDLGGTFLFHIYVMTALGFGAPVPHTIWGRTSALIYAVLAVPIHIFLMVNASTCIIYSMDNYILRRTAKLRDEEPADSRNALENTENPNYRNKSEVMKNSNKGFRLRQKLARILSIVYVGRCIPAATAVYYSIGVVSFGVLRGRNSLKAVLFPLEFTTTGGLEHVESLVRVVYGLYVEGAMSLLACAFAALRAHSSSALSRMANTHRLFTVHRNH